MTIDEAIKHAREVAESNRIKHENEYRIFGLFPKDEAQEFIDECEKCAKEHEQLAEWLELLKWYQQGMEDIPSESGVLPKDVYRAGYIKAIDDFFDELQRYEDDDWLRLKMSSIYEIAEQLKAGVVDG